MFAASSSPAPSSVMVAARRGTGLVLRCESSRTTFSSNTKYGHGVDWPITYSELQQLWALAEKEIGVSANTAQQQPLEVVGLVYPPGYEYPMQSIPMSIVDQAVSNGMTGLQVPGTLPDTPGGSDPTMYDVFVTPTPAGSQLRTV